MNLDPLIPWTLAMCGILPVTLLVAMALLDWRDRRIARRVRIVRMVNQTLRGLS